MRDRHILPPSLEDLPCPYYRAPWWRRWSALDWSLAVSVVLALACVAAAVALVGGGW